LQPSSPPTSPASVPPPASVSSSASLPSPTPSAAKAPTKIKSSPPVVARASPPKPEPTRPLSVAPEPAPPSTVEVEIVSSPAGAEVVLDGKVVGKTPYHGTHPRSDLAVKLSLRLSNHAQEQLIVYPRGPIKQVVKLRHVADGQSANPFK
jgi:hypothetical protein